MELLGPAPPLPLFEGPLFAGGRRRVGPNRWGFDPFSPNLDPAEEPRDRPRFKRRAIEFWGTETYHRRAALVPELKERLRGRRSKRLGTVVAPIERRHHKRADRTEEHHRFARWLAAHADAQSGEVGLWIGGGEHRRFRLEDIAARVGLSPDQTDRVIRDFVAAGFIYRHQQREREEREGVTKWRGGVALLRVLHRFWQVCGADGLRRAFVERQARKAEKRARRARPPAAPPIGYSGPGARSVRDYVGALAAAQPAPWPPKGDPPPT